uniref:Putative metastriate insulin growth factor binding protein n=1 Tax=Amblyomma tuberculatum TaxID=48802 RepID=A0A6M2E224_9ACAR
MKIVAVLAVIVAVAVVSAWAASPPNCAGVKCDPSTCPVVQCSCGSRKDYCGCCDYCYKCPGEECRRLFRNPCSVGYHCVLDDPEKRILPGGRGHCKPRPAAAAEHVHHS